MKTAIVFGATSGIGKEISELLLKDGYKVAIRAKLVNIPSDIHAAGT